MQLLTPIDEYNVTMNIRGKLQVVAESELFETDQRRTECLAAFRNLILNSSKIQVCRLGK